VGKPGEHVLARIRMAKAAVLTTSAAQTSVTICARTDAAEDARHDRSSPAAVRLAAEVSARW
jgi:hypothetical protein